MMLTNLNIYFSAACNLHYEYRYMPPHSMPNSDIIKTLRNGVFVQRVNQYITEDIISLSIYGMEPAINAEYFEYFMLPILKLHPQIKYINLATDLFSNHVLDDMIEPLNRYAAREKHKLILNLQVNLDGPQYIHNKHIGREDAYLHLYDNLSAIGRAFNFHINKYFRVKVYNKSILTAQDLYTDPDEWWQFMGAIQSDMDALETYSFKANFLNPPTLASSNEYTKADGQELVKWNLKFNTLTCREHACGKTIDCYGRVWDCPMLYNKDIDEQSIRDDFNIKVEKLLQEGEIIETNKEALWNAISSIYCWATGNNRMPESYIKLLGNGALQEV